ncbi:MAG: hypothetical protein JSU94_16850 [Phycisphaerales bacterium]|nr:MAG: hypothetical protein JSU94_16850 [Phycisphaerales bacterium]
MTRSDAADSLITIQFVLHFATVPAAHKNGTDISACPYVTYE